MPQQFFNASFMYPVVHDTATDFSVIYEGAPIYFAPISGTDINKQLELFRNSPDFSLFKFQYEKLLDNLRMWCSEHECDVLIYDELAGDEAHSSAFTRFKKYFFYANNFYENGETALFNEGKKSLEELWLLLENEYIPFDGKCKVLMELQAGLGVCADGILTNICNAINDLKAYTGINEALQQIKTEFIQQHAILKTLSLFGDTDNYKSFEIHYVNAFYNHVAQDFGLSEQSDSYITIIKQQIASYELLHFQKILHEQFTPPIMLGFLLVKLSGDWSALHTELSATLKIVRTSWNTIDNSGLIETMGENALFIEEKILLTDALEQWNQKYGALIKLSFYDLADIDDNNLIVLHDLPTLNKILEPKIIRQFSEHFLESNNQFRLQLQSNLILCSHHGLLWCERDQIPEFITLEHIKNINLTHLSFEEQVHYCFVLEQLFTQFPEELTELSCMLNSLEQRFLNIIWAEGLIDCIVNLDRIQQGDFLNHYAEADQPGLQKLIIRYPEKLLTHLCKRCINEKTSLRSMLNLNCNFEGIGETTLLGYAVHFQYWDLIQKLALNFWFTTEHLLTPIHYKNHHEINLLWIIALEQRWELLDELIELNLVTSTQLASYPSNEESDAKGLNGLYFLGRSKCWYVIDELLSQKIITTELLIPIIQEGEYQGINFLWLLANNKQWNLIEILLQQDLIRSSMLAAMPLGGEFEGINVLYLFGNYQQWDTLKQLFNQEDFITAELLAPPVFKGVSQGINLLWILAYHQQWELINLLLQHRLINPSMLAAMPIEGDCQGVNVLYLFGHYQQWDTLKQLFNQEHLITAELLTPTVLTGASRGTNLLWILANSRQWGLIHVLLQHQLIKHSMLAAMPLEGDCQGINVLYLLGYYKQWNVIKKLLSQQVITTELLAPLALEKENQGTTLLNLLIDSKQWALIGIFVQQNLLTAEQQGLVSEKRNLLSTNIKFPQVFFKMLDNKESKRKAIDKQDECCYESSLKKHKH